MSKFFANRNAVNNLSATYNYSNHESNSVAEIASLPTARKDSEEKLKSNKIASFPLTLDSANSQSLAEHESGKTKQNFEEAASKYRRKQQLPKPSQIAGELREKYNNELAWNVKDNSWYEYKPKLGIWISLKNISIQKKIQIHLDQDESTRDNYSLDYVIGIIGLLQAYLSVEDWNEAFEMLPFENGILDLKTGKLLSHCADSYLTWRLPYLYDRLATCNPIQEWLLETMKGDEQLVEVLRAYLNAIVKGRTDLQRFLECVGPGGTGKSTFTQLAVALVGRENVFSTSLKQLETNRFETAGIYGKRFILIADSEEYTGDVSTLKAIVGQDPIRHEKKFVQQSTPFVAKAMVLITANQNMQSKDYTSGFQRRRLTIPFAHQVAPANRRDLITLNNDNTIVGEFAPYISGLLNWVLGISDEHVTELIRNTERSVPTLLAVKGNTLCETNPMADWLDHWVVCDKEAKTYIGDQEMEVSKYLYPNYIRYCKATRTSSVSLKKFSGLLVDLCKNQLGLDSVEKARDRVGSHILGLRLRTENDKNLPSPVTGHIFPDESVTASDGKVMAETPAIINVMDVMD